MRRSTVFLMLLALGLAACRGGTTSPTILEAAGPDLSGVGFEVHQEPG